MRDVAPPRYGLRLTSATNLPYADDTFDAVFCSYVIDVVSDKDREHILREIRRVLTPNGRAVFVYPAAPQSPVERVWTVLFQCCPILFGGARLIDLRGPLKRLDFRIDGQTSLTQGGLRSRITLVRIN